MMSHPVTSPNPPPRKTARGLSCRSASRCGYLSTLMEITDVTDDEAIDVAQDLVELDYLRRACAWMMNIPLGRDETMASEIARIRGIAADKVRETIASRERARA